MGGSTATVADADGDRSPTQRGVLEATYRALREHGYADLTLRRIADEFEKSRSLIYYLYPTKDELVAATV